MVGDDPSVGITLTDSEGAETRIKAGAIGLNQPSKLIFLVPANLAAGDYTLTITTQFNGGYQLKTPRSVSQTIKVAESEEEGGTPGGV